MGPAYFFRGSVRKFLLCKLRSTCREWFVDRLDICMLSYQTEIWVSSVPSGLIALHFEHLQSVI